MAANQHGVPGEWARVKGTVLSLWPLFLACALLGAFVTALVAGCYPPVFGVAVVAAFAFAAFSWRRGLRRVQSFFLGARGEERVARLLAALPDGWHVFHDFVAGGYHVDHVVVGPTGVYAVETKNWRGRTEMREGHLLVDGRLPSRPPIDQALRECDAVKAEIRRAGGDVAPVPVVCFASDTFVPGTTAAGTVTILNASGLDDWLLARPAALDPNAVERLVQLMQVGR